MQQNKVIIAVILTIIIIIAIYLYSKNKSSFIADCSTCCNAPNMFQMSLCTIGGCVCR